MARSGQSEAPEGTEAAGVSSFGALVANIRREYKTYNRDSSRPGFRAIAVYRFGRWAMARPRSTLSRRFTKHLLDRIYLMLHRYVRNHYGIELQRTATVGDDVLLAHQGGIVIHRYADVGDRCLIHHNVTIGNAGRGISEHDAPKIGSDVELGVGAVVLGSVTIGDGANIGANVVVYTDVEPETTLVHGAPRIVRAPQTRRSRAGSDVSPGSPDR